jgi:transposase
MSILELFCTVDDFCHWFAQTAAWYALGAAKAKRGTKPTLALSEVMTIIIHFHQSHYRDFKAYYTQHVMVHLRSEFPHLVSYNRFVELMPGALLPLCVYLYSRLAVCHGLGFIDSTPLPVCHNKRIRRHKVFAGLAARGKTSLGWFYGFKLHLIVDDHGDLLAFYLTPGNVDDRKPVPHMAHKLWGKLFGDKGYLSQALFERLFHQGLQLITPLRKNMPNRLMPLMDKLLARKRSIIETINDQLKNISQIAHTRHRSPTNFLVNLIAGLIAYTHQPKKPSLHLSDRELAMLPVLC